MLKFKISARSFGTAIILMNLILFATFWMPALALPMELCWHSLAPDTGDQNVGLATTKPTLASSGAGEIWLTWEENSPRILHWVKDRWSTVPTPSRSGYQAMRYPVVTAGCSGSVILACSANGEYGTSAVHIARWSGASWEWLGEPLISSMVPFTHANETSIAFEEGEKPIVAWSEERHVKLAGLFVARWDGSQWQRLGQLKTEGDDHYLSPTIVVNASKQIWLCWKEGRNGSLRVARWDGASWCDIGREALKKLTHRRGSASEPSLVVDSKGRAWVLWHASKEPGKDSLFMARWNGSSWSLVRVPHVRGRIEAKVWSAQMILQNDVPTVVWSQSDETENHRLYAAEWKKGDQWIQRISGLHLVEGVSDVRDVRLATGDGQSFFVFWDEIGKDKRRSRLVRVYACEPGEAPATPPKSVVEHDIWPKTVKEAASQIAGMLDDDSRERVRSTKKSDLIQYHHGWGTGIRNSFGLWRGNEQLLKSCGQGEIVHPDRCSMIIIEAVWDLLQVPPSQPYPASSREN